MLSRKTGLNRKLGLSRIRKAVAGFTLIEVMVAIMVFASLSIAAYQVVNQVQRSNEQSAEKTVRLQQIQRAMIVLESDFRQMAARTFKGRANATTTRMLYAGEYVLDSDSNGILFTRLGWQNPQQAFPRGEVLKVGYRLVEHKLERVWWRYPDSAEGQEPLTRDVLDKVEGISFRFYADDQWQPTWESENQLPSAVEVNMTLQDYGKIRRVFLIAPGASSSALNENSDNDSADEVTQ